MKSSSETSHPSPSLKDRSKERSVSDYLPLLVVVGVSAAAAAAKMHALGPGMGFGAWMHDFMGFFLVVFAMLKLFDLPGFADGFQKYDLIAKRARPYALLYPLIELALGLAYLARWRVDLVYPVTVMVMTVGAVGVMSRLAKYRRQRACPAAIRRSLSEISSGSYLASPSDPVYGASKAFA